MVVRVRFPPSPAALASVALLLLIQQVASSADGLNKFACDSTKYLPSPHPSVPCFIAPPCESSEEPALLHIAELSSGKGPFPAQTTVSVCHNPQGLLLMYTSLNETFFQNDKRECNSETYLQEVVEVFISPILQDSPYYHEIELTPYSTLYVSSIINPYLNGTDIVHDMVPCDKSGIVHKSTRYTGLHRWDGLLQLPWDLVSHVNKTQPLASASAPLPVGLGSSAEAVNPNPPTKSSVPRVVGPIAQGNPGDVYRVNFFRVVMETLTTVCTPGQGDCAFGAWSPTDIYPAAFHYPARFGVMVLG